MKFALVFAAVLAVSAAQYNGFNNPSRSTQRPVANRNSNGDQAATVNRFVNVADPSGNFNYAYEIDNGIAGEAEGSLKDFGGNPPVAAVVSKGSFSWVAPGGELIKIDYFADENGYQPSGDAIPTPHPIPEAILKSLEYNAKNQKQ